MTEEPKVSELITMQEAARYCGRSHPQVLWYVRSGRLKAWKVGMQWLTTEKEVDRYFKSRNSRGEWLNQRQKMTKFARIRAGYRCEHCGRAEGSQLRCQVLTVRHLDGDETNWEPENLMAVCWPCYWSLQEHFSHRHSERLKETKPCHSEQLKGAKPRHSERLRGAKPRHSERLKGVEESPE
jgi:excisionase family DNA binding protein